MKSRTPLLAVLLLVLAIAPRAHATALRWEPRWQSIAPGAVGSAAVMLSLLLCGGVWVSALWARVAP